MSTERPWERSIDAERPWERSVDTDGPPGDDIDWPVVEEEKPPSAPPKRRTLKVTLLISLAIILIVGGGGWLWVNSQMNPGGKSGPVVSVVIPKGASTSLIGNILAKAGVVHNGTLFTWYIRFRGDSALYPGDYELPKNSHYAAIAAALQAGPQIPTANLVIPEGYTLRQIAQAVGALPGMGLSAQAFMNAASSGTVRSPYEPPDSTNLEGLLFPATYQVRQGESVDTILQEMVTAFDQRVQGLDLQSAAARVGYSPYQVITVASIVEREARLAVDRGPVASALYNRLHAGMPLGADSTQTYFLRLTDPTIQPTATQLDQRSPYNTRTNTGLPPTPIANPGLAALQAAASPPTTTYIYFVEINPDGKLGFASTQQGFEQLQAQCRAANLC